MRKTIKFICLDCDFEHETMIYSQAGYELEKAKAFKHFDDEPKHTLKRVK